MKRFAIVFSALLLAATTAPTAHAEVVYDTLNSSQTFGNNGGYVVSRFADDYYTSVAIAFTAAANLTVTHIQANIESLPGQGQSLTLVLMNDAGGKPSGSSLFQASATASNISPIMLSVNWALSEAGTYWLAAIASDGSYVDWNINYDIPKTLMAFEANFRADPSPWQANDDDAAQVRIEGVYAVAAVPEPSTWAMMALGFAGVGYMTYRRRKVAALTA